MKPSLLIDLGASGLVPEDFNAREVGAPELAATNTSTTVNEGYVIPYYDISGKPVAFYRIKFLNQEPKYKQPKSSINHIYYPPNFSKALNGHNYVILTEGEKKAAAATKAGFPAVALGGVNSWKTRTILLPGDVKLERVHNKTKQIRARVPSNFSYSEGSSAFAEGFRDLIDLLIKKDLHIVIIFDTDSKDGVKVEVQRAAAHLGHEFRYQGVPLNHIKQAVLPTNKLHDKVGLDDFLVNGNSKQLTNLIEDTLISKDKFPKHPNLKAYLNGKLNSQRLDRKDYQEISLSVLSELDARGRRLRNEDTQEPYFFDETTSHLLPAALLRKNDDPLHESPFGTFLYKEFGLSAVDHKLITWLAAQFTGEEPIEPVSPHRLLTTHSDSQIAYQVSDSEFALISDDPSNPIEILSNGSEGILFEQGQVEPLNSGELIEEFNKQNDSKKPIKPYWLDVLKNVNFKDNSQQIEFATLLYYLSPWLSRWRGLQLPVEIICGEPNSGKSSLCSLRLQILSGQPRLRNIPTDLRDWHASVSNVGGLHIIDNVQFTNKDIRQRISDEMCRIVTEPNPHIEMRKLYTSSSQLQIPITAIFVLTALQQPFHNSDLIQRSFILDLQAIPPEEEGGGIDGDWVSRHLQKFGGRTKWVAHHLHVIHKFLVNANKLWDSNYKATNRLAHYEQCLKIMAKTINVDLPDLGSSLAKATQGALSEADWAMEGLKAFATKIEIDDPSRRFTASEITEWCQGEEEYDGNHQLTNTRRLGRYLQAHKSVVAMSCNVIEIGSYANQKQYGLRSYQIENKDKPRKIAKKVLKSRKPK